MSVVVSGLLSRAKAFWPMLAGIICARTALIVACYGSYASTDDGIFTDGSMFVTCALFIVALLIFSRSRRELGATAVQWIMVGSIIVAAGASMALSLLDSADQILVATAFALSIANTLALSLCMFYWLRCLRGTDEVTAALFVVSAFVISVGIVYLLSCLPTRAQNIIGMALIVAQFAFLGPAGLRAEHPTERPHRRARTFFTFARSNIQDSRFLAACAVGMALLGFVDGFLRGSPDGLPIPFTWSSRLAYALCSMLICALLMLLVVRRRERVMTVDAFITMALLASLSLVLFGAFPYHWEIGAVAVNTLNIVICAYCWYVIIAFTSFGTRDPYIYAMGGWVICFGSRSLARMLLYRWPATICSSTRFSGLLSSFPPKWFSCSSCTPSAENRLRKPIAWRPRTSESCARPKPMRPSRRRRWPKLSKRCRASYSTPRDARPPPSKQPPRL